MSRSIAATAVVYANVVLGADVVVEEYCIIGVPVEGAADEPTTIGDGALIRSHTVIYAGNRIGHRFRTGNKANIRELNRIGNDVSIGTLAVVEHHVENGQSRAHPLAGLHPGVLDTGRRSLDRSERGADEREVSRSAGREGSAPRPSRLPAGQDRSERHAASGGGDRARRARGSGKRRDKGHACEQYRGWKSRRGDRSRPLLSRRK